MTTSMPSLPPPFDAFFSQAGDIALSIVAAGLLMMALGRPTRWATDRLVPLLPLPFRVPAVIGAVLLRLVAPAGAALWLYNVLPGRPG